MAEDKKEEKRNFFDLFTEIIGWIQIVVSPLLISAVIGAFVYFSHPTTLRLVFGIAIVAVGLIAGIIWATRIWKKKGTINFISRISATPELDDDDNHQS